MALPIRVFGSKIIRTPRETCVHPVTKEVYGLTDYSDPKKLAEMEAVPHVDPTPDPVTPPSAEQIAARKVELRALRYKNECDPHLLAVLGYDLEIAAEQDETKRAAIAEKRGKEAQSYLTKKAAIRAEVK